MIRLHHRHQYIGCFLPTEENLAGHAITALDYGLYSFSFSLGNNRNYKRTRIEEDDMYTTMGLLLRFPMIVFSFLPKMYNLCGHQNTLAWNGNITQDTHTSMVLDEITYELDILSKLHGSVVVEAGAFRDKNAGIDACIQSLTRIPFKMGYRLMLMNSLDAHHNIATTLQDLHTIYTRIELPIRSHMYVCIHIAHLFANGLYDTRYPSEITRFFQDLDLLFPKFVITMIYLTDTHTEFGSKQYIEARVGTGEMWCNTDSIHEILRQSQERYITVMMANTDDMEFIRHTSQILHSPPPPPFQ